MDDVEKSPANNSDEELRYGYKSYRQLLDPELCVGRTVTAASTDDNYAGVAFSDGTYIVFEAVTLGDVIIEVHEYVPDDSMLHALKLIDENEYARRRTAAEAAARAANEAAERRQLEQLQKKYGRG
jgi:hypothetical protein